MDGNKSRSRCVGGAALARYGREVELVCGEDAKFLGSFFLLTSLRNTIWFLFYMIHASDLVCNALVECYG